LTVLTTAQSYASRRIEGIPTRISQIWPIQAIDWFAWALLVPALIAVASAIEWRDRPRDWLAIVWTTLALVFASLHALVEVVVARFSHTVPTRMPFITMLPARLAETLVGSVIVAGVVVLSFYAMKHYGEAMLREQREATLEAQLAEARLNVLRHQLQPHFLFNTLHTISALISDDVAGARRVITRLGDLLRSSLDTAEQHEVPLRDELTFLNHYLDIQRTRFGDRLTVDIAAASGLEHALVPSMLLQPLVENSIRHAVEPRATGGRVSVRARRDEQTMLLEVVDDGPGFIESSGDRRGIGIANTRARLEQLYGGAQRFEIENLPGGGLRASLRIPYRENGQ
jgi:two-component sensor histidine kinase